MKRLLSFFFFFCLLSPGESQVTISILPETFTKTGTTTQPIVSYDVEIVNTSSIDLELLWSQRLNSAPVQWKSYICDINRCYDTLTISCPIEHPNHIASGDTILVQMHILPKGIVGMGELQLNLSDLEGTLLGTITGNYIINLSSSSSEAEKELPVVLYPNPASCSFQISDYPGLKKVGIYNVLGNLIRTVDSSSSQLYSVGDLSEGIYFIELIGSVHEILKTIPLRVNR